MVAPKSFPALGLDGRAIIAMHHFVLGTPKTVACLTLLMDASPLAFFVSGNVAPKAATTNGSVAPAGGMAKDDFFAAPEPVGRMVYGGAKAEHGLDDRFEKTTATTSAHSILVCWRDSRPTKRSARFRNFPGRRRFLPGVKNAWQKVAMGMFADFKQHEVAMCFRVKRLEWNSPAENRDQQHPEKHAQYSEDEIHKIS
jgi:hypothetical protein